MDAYEKIIQDLNHYQNQISEDKLKKKIKPLKREINDLMQML